ncbi:zeta toxin family protein [Patescibacteria group bacterium]
MNFDESQLSKDALIWVKKNSKIIIEKFANLNEFPRSEKPITIFMAGSPGAGKTEFSESFDPDIYKFSEDQITKIVRIDADKIRELIPQYEGHNSSEVQRASSKGVDILFDYVQGKNQNVILDGTFANFKISEKNVRRALGRDRTVGIFYLYQEPKVAWNFTQQRELKEGRNISKTIFKEAYISAKENVNKVKEIYGGKVILNLIIKNFENKVAKYYINIKKVDDHLKTSYTIGQLDEMLK